MLLRFVYEQYYKQHEGCLCKQSSNCKDACILEAVEILSKLLYSKENYEHGS